MSSFCTIVDKELFAHVFIIKLTVGDTPIDREQSKLSEVTIPGERGS